MVWSTSEVLADTLQRCAAADLRVHRVAEWYDVDGAADLDRPLRRSRQRRIPTAPATRAALATVLGQPPPHSPSLSLGDGERAGG